jgi:hypothetical protein
MAAGHARNDWLLLVDPDERFPEALVGDIQAAMAAHPGAAAFRLPWQFYFKGRRLDGTVWGGPNRFKRFLVHRQRCELQPLNHRQAQVIEGGEFTIAPTDDNHVYHDWSASYASLIERHFRYLSREGEGLYATGARFSPRRLFLVPAQGFKRSLVDHAGWRIGPRGVVLSAIYAGWLAGSAVSLLMHQLGVKPARRAEGILKEKPGLETREAV